MGEQGVDEAGGVDQQQNDRNPEAQPLVDQGDVCPGCSDAFGEIEHGGQQNGDDHQEQHRRQQTGAGLVEGLASAPNAADQGGNAEKQQCGADNRAGDLRLDDPDTRLPQDEEGEHQLGGITEADVEQAADRAAGTPRQLLGGAPKPIGEHGDGGGTGQEDPAGRRLEEIAQSQG
jgi:hypothetical protein